MLFEERCDDRGMIIRVKEWRLGWRCRNPLICESTLSYFKLRRGKTVKGGRVIRKANPRRKKIPGLVSDCYLCIRQKMWNWFFCGQLASSHILIATCVGLFCISSATVSPLFKKWKIFVFVSIWCYYGHFCYRMKYSLGGSKENAAVRERRWSGLRGERSAVLQSLGRLGNGRRCVEVPWGLNSGFILGLIHNALRLQLHSIHATSGKP